jgi:TP901 family phage tail tape measure protein
MARTIESNLIIKSRLPKPTGAGLESILSTLTDIDRLITKINRRELKVRVRLDGDKDVLTSLEKTLDAANRAARRAAKSTPAAPAAPAAAQPGVGALVSTGNSGVRPTGGGGGVGGGGSGGGGQGGGFFGVGNQLKEKITVTPGEQGDSAVRERTFGAVDGGKAVTTTVRQDAATNELLSATQITEDLQAQAKQRFEKKLGEQNEAKRLTDEREKQARDLAQQEFLKEQARKDAGGEAQYDINEKFKREAKERAQAEKDAREAAAAEGKENDFDLRERLKKKAADESKAEKDAREAAAAEGKENDFDLRERLKKKAADEAKAEKDAREAAAAEGKENDFDLRERLKKKAADEAKAEKDAREAAAAEGKENDFDLRERLKREAKDKAKAEKDAEDAARGEGRENDFDLREKLKREAKDKAKAEKDAEDAARSDGREADFDLRDKLKADAKERAKQEREAKDAEKEEARERDDILKQSLRESEAYKKERKKLQDERDRQEGLEIENDLKAQNKSIEQARKRAERITNEQEKLREFQRQGSDVDRTLTASGARRVSQVDQQAPLRSDPTQLSTTTVTTYNRALADGSELIQRYDTATGKLTSTVNRSTQTYRDNARYQRLLNNETQATAQVTDLQRAGFAQHSEQLKRVSIGNREVTTSMREFRRVTGSTLLGNLAVDIAKVDTATGKMTTRTVRANEALRLLGDNFASAVGKVSLWLAATSAVFAFSRAVQFGVQQLKELEANTVFLARVGSNLSTPGAGFAERYKEAKLLTDAIIEQSKALGVDAVSSQRAASVFLRAGQDRVQALQSTRAAMVAARIAELDVEEAAKLLSAAQIQFKLSNDQLMPTLDTLNSLSNKYRVSTDDLLQSISRSGSIYAETNGQLSELAATTAVTAQVTARSGAEIGNAIKTIQSRLNSPEISGELLAKAGISMRDAEGNAKSYVKVLLQLQSALAFANNAERSRIPVTVAGARQVNILKSQIENVIEIVIAEARALRDEASANIEATETAQTLESAMLRLQATFTETVNNSAAVTNTLLTAFTGTINLLGKLANAYDGIVVKLALFVGMTLLMRALLTRMIAIYTANSASIALMGATMAGTTAAAGGLTVALRVLMTAMGPVGWAALAISLALSALIYVMGQAEQSEAQMKIMADQAAESQDKLAMAAERRRRATQALSDALQEQIQAQIRINQAEADGKKIDPDAKERVQQNIKRLTGEQGLNLPQFKNGAKTDAELIALDTANKAALKKSLDEEKKTVASRLKSAERDKGEKDRDIGFAKERLNQQFQIIDSFQRTGQGEDAAVEAAREYAKIEKELEKLQGEAGDAAGKVDELKMKLEELSSVKIAAPLTDEFIKASRAGEEALQIYKRFQDVNAGAGKLGTDTAATRTANQAQQTKVLTEAQDKAAFALTALKDNMDSPEFDRYTKTINDITLALENMGYAAANNRIKDLGEYFKKSFESLPLQRERAKQDARINDILLPNANGGEQFAGVRDKDREIELLKQQAKAALEARNTLDMEDVGGSKEEFIARQQSLEEVGVDALAKARELELERAMDILEIERNIVKERQNQNRETLKALGLLGDEDKLLVLQQAAFFNKNPNRKISAQEQFFASAETNQINQRFFGNKLADQFDPADPFARSLLNAGIGPQNQELDAAEAELKKRFDAEGGRDGVVRNAIKENKDLLGIEQQAQGKPIPNQTGTIIDFKLDGMKPPITAADFEPMIRAFETATAHELIKVRNELIGEIQRVWDTVRAIPAELKLDIPQVAP